MGLTVGAGVELASSGDRQANDGDQRDNDIEDDGRGLQAGEQRRAVGTKDAAEHEDADKETKGRTSARRKIWILECDSGEENPRAGPAE